jgi:hypothetical protein
MTRSSFTPEIVMSHEQKQDYHDIEFLTHKPSRTALRVGIILKTAIGAAPHE